MNKMEWYSIKDKIIRLGDSERIDIYVVDPHNHSYRITDVSTDVISHNGDVFVYKKELIITHWRYSHRDFPREYIALERENYNTLYQ